MMNPIWRNGLVRTFRPFTNRRPSRPLGHARRRVRPTLERLEDRSLPSVTIAPTNNSGNGYAALSIDQAPDANGNYWVPPDTNGAAGPTNYIETVNSSVALYSPKATGATQTSDSFIHFFGTVGGLPLADSGAFYSDPAVIYDDNIPGATPTTGRFIVTDENVDISTGVSVFDIAISKSASPATLTAADWSFYQINTGEAGGLWADYPGNLGYNQDALVVNFNMFSSAGFFSGNDQVLAVSISDMVNGVPNSSLTYTQTDVSVASDTNVLRPATEHDAGAGAPEWLVSTADSSHINVYQMTNLLTTPSIGTPTPLLVTPYSGVVPPLQPDGSAITFNIDSRIQKAAEYGNTLVAAHAVSVSSTQDDIQWYQIDVSGGTPVLSDQGRVDAGPNTYLVYPAIDINASGTIGMTYSQSGTDSSTDYMSAYLTGRTSSDPAGTMQTPVLVPAGTGTVNNFDGREGDLSGINLDPSDGSFWATTEYATPSSFFGCSWGTAVANFTVGPTITTTADLALTNTGPATANEGDNNLTYTMVVTNGGPDDAPNTVLTDHLGPNLKFVSATTGKGTFTVSGSTVTFNMGTVAAGQTVTATVTAQATEDGTLTNSASVSSSSGDPTPGDNSASASTTVSESSIIVSGPIALSGNKLKNVAVATFTHANGVEPASAFAATINWGDGTTSAGTITQSGTTYTVTGSHQYKGKNSKGPHTITTSVTETGSAPNAPNSTSSATLLSAAGQPPAATQASGTAAADQVFAVLSAPAGGSSAPQLSSAGTAGVAFLADLIGSPATIPPSSGSSPAPSGPAGGAPSAAAATDLFFNFGAQGLGLPVGAGTLPRNWGGWQGG